MKLIRSLNYCPFASETYCIWQLKNGYGSMFFECKKAENMQEINKNLHIFGLLIISIYFNT